MSIAGSCPRSCRRAPHRSRADLEAVAAAAEARVVAPELLLADDRVPVLGDVVDTGVAGHEGAAVVRLQQRRRQRRHAVDQPRHHLAHMRVVGAVVVGLGVDRLLLLRPAVADEDLAADVRPAVERLRHVRDDREVLQALGGVEDRLVLAAELERVVDPHHAADPVAPGAARVDDDAGRDLTVAGDDAGNAAARGRDAEHLAALVDVEAVALGRADERLDREHGIGEARRRLVTREPDALELELGPAAHDLVGLERRRLDAEARAALRRCREAPAPPSGGAKSM